MKYNLNIEQGIPFEQGFVIRNEDNSLKDLTGYSAYMHFRLFPSSSNIELNANTMNSMIQIEGSVVYIRLNESITNTLKYRNYYFDLELNNVQDEPFRLLEGEIVVTQRITR